MLAVRAGGVEGVTVLKPMWSPPSGHAYPACFCTLRGFSVPGAGPSKQGAGGMGGGV